MQHAVPDLQSQKPSRLRTLLAAKANTELNPELLGNSGNRVELRVPGSMGSFLSSRGVPGLMGSFLSSRGLIEGFWSSATEKTISKVAILRSTCNPNSGTYTLTFQVP